MSMPWGCQFGAATIDPPDEKELPAPGMEIFVGVPTGLPFWTLTTKRSTPSSKRLTSKASHWPSVDQAGL
jgi:hypothetical protein